MIIIIENDVEFGKRMRGAWNQKSHERKSKNYIKYKETKKRNENQNNLFCNWQTYTNTYISNKKLYIIVLYLAFYSSKTKTN